MSSTQDKLAVYHDRRKRKCFDSRIKKTGREVTIYNITPRKDSRGNVDSHLISDPVEYPILLPKMEDLPLIRFKNVNTGAKEGSTGISFWDVIPMEIYAPSQTKLEKDDVIVHFIDDEDDDDDCFMLILKVVEIYGNFSNSLIYKKYIVSPNTGTVPEEVMEYLQSLRDGYK